MALMIDDAPWATLQTPVEAFEDALDDFVDLIQLAQAKGLVVNGFAEIWDTPVIGASTLVSLLFDSDGTHNLRPDLRRRLQLVFDKMNGAMLDLVVVSELEAQVGGVAQISPSAVYAWEKRQEGMVVGCLTPATSCRSGPTEVKVNGVAADVFYVPTEPALVEQFRFAITSENANAGRFSELAQVAFAQLEFVEGVWGGLRDLSVGFRDRRDELHRHLTVLNDEGAGIFALRRNLAIEKAFGEHGITISLETAETMANGKCRRARERSYGGEVLVFEWHMKLELHRDRIHVHPGTEASGGKVIVGIIHRHLPLPGD